MQSVVIAKEWFAERPMASAPANSRVPPPRHLCIIILRRLKAGPPFRTPGAAGAPAVAVAAAAVTSAFSHDLPLPCRSLPRVASAQYYTHISRFFYLLPHSCFFFSFSRFSALLALALASSGAAPTLSLSREYYKRRLLGVWATDRDYEDERGRKIEVGESFEDLLGALPVGGKKPRERGA